MGTGWSQQVSDRLSLTTSHEELGRQARWGLGGLHCLGSTEGNRCAHLGQRGLPCSGRIMKRACHKATDKVLHAAGILPLSSLCPSLRVLACVGPLTQTSMSLHPLVPSVHTWLWPVFSERVSIPLTHLAMPHQLSSPHSRWRTACASCGTCPTTCTRRYLGLTGTRRLSLGPRAVLRAPSAGGGMTLAALVARRPKVGLGYHFRTTPPCSPAECSPYP